MRTQASAPGPGARAAAASYAGALPRGTAAGVVLHDGGREGLCTTVYLGAPGQTEQALRTACMRGRVRTTGGA
eukprot:7368300-Alexandrium_andersonii.AAC.1